MTTRDKDDSADSKSSTAPRDRIGLRQRKQNTNSEGLESHFLVEHIISIFSNGRVFRVLHVRSEKEKSSWDSC